MWDNIFGWVSRCLWSKIQVCSIWAWFSGTSSTPQKISISLPEELQFIAIAKLPIYYRKRSSGISSFFHLEFVVYLSKLPKKRLYIVLCILSCILWSYKMFNIRDKGSLCPKLRCRAFRILTFQLEAKDCWWRFNARSVCMVFIVNSITF